MNSNSTHGHIDIEEHGKILVARIDGGPHALFDVTISKQLKELVDRADRDPNIHAVVFTGVHPGRLAIELGLDPGSHSGKQADWGKLLFGKTADLLAHAADDRIAGCPAQPVVDLLQILDAEQQQSNCIVPRTCIASHPVPCVAGASESLS